MTTFLTLPHPTQPGRLVRALDTGAVQARPMAKNYRVTEPGAIALALERAGWHTTIEQPAHLMKANREWNRFVRARLADGPDRPVRLTDGGDPYGIGVLIHCGHQGRHSLAVIPEVERVYCANQFTLAPYRVHHTNPQIDQFLDNPDPVCRQVAAAGREGLRRLEWSRAMSLACHPDAVLNLFCHRPRLQLALARTVEEHGYRLCQGWGLLQALTHTRARAFADVATLCLTRDWPYLEAGELPPALLAAARN